MNRQATPLGTSPTTAPIAPTAADARVCDVTRKYVRVRQVRADGLVCFEFAIGWPELFVDLMLPRAAFDDFCERQHVQLLND
jgi:phenol hydroxylase P0 protein